MATINKGALVISLDFELYWGVRDSRSINDYGEHILGVRKVIPALLELFDRYGVNATFATVGFLFCNGKDELIHAVPSITPTYSNESLSPYNGYINNLGSTE